MVKQDVRFLTRQALWMLWHNRKFLLEFRDKLWPEYLASPEARYLLKVATEHFDSYGAAPTETVLRHRLDEDESRERLDREDVTPDGVWDLYEDLPSVAKEDRIYVRREVSDFCQRQRLSFALREALTTLDEEGLEPAFDIINEAKTELQKPEARTGSLIAGDYDMMLRVGVMEAEDNYCSTGLVLLDRMMGGGLKPGELACFVAPTGRGKSMWLCHLAYFGMMQGLDVVYYTFEVDRDEIQLRIKAAATGLSIDDWKKVAAYGYRDPEYGGSLKPAQLWAEFLHNRSIAGANGKDVEIRDIPPRQATVNGIIADLDSLRAAGRDPRLILVDYADRMQSRGRFERAWEGQPQVYQDLVSLAKEQDLAIWTAAQGNRTALETKKLNLQHIQGAFSKTFEASYVIAAGQDESMRIRNYSQFYMAKARRSQGANQRMWVWYDLSTSRFLHAIQPEDVENPDELLPMTKIMDLEEDEVDSKKEKFG